METFILTSLKLTWRTVNNALTALSLSLSLAVCYGRVVFTHAGLYSQAIPLLSALVQTTKYSQAGVWLKHAECQHMLNDPAAAAISYSKVISLAPHHIDSRYVYAINQTILRHRPSDRVCMCMVYIHVG